jgi:hypothetical protein
MQIVTSWFIINSCTGLNKAKSPDAFIPFNVTAKPQFQPQPKAVLAVPLGVLERPNGARLVIHSPELLALLPSLLTR